MKVYTLNSSYTFGSNTYIIECNGEYAVIDPSLDFKTASLKLDGLTPENVKYILLTHAHFDHIFFVDSWHEITGLPVSISEKEAPALGNSYLNCYHHFLNIDKGYYGELTTLKHGDTLKLGEDFIKVIETPGHTQGSLSFKIGDSLFVGDTVFAEGGIGRTDLPGGNFDMLMRSIERIKTQDENLKVYSGHGPSTTISNIIKGN